LHVFLEKDRTKNTRLAHYQSNKYNMTFVIKINLKIA